MGSMHYRPMPRGYRVRPFFPTKVRVSTLAKNIGSGDYDVIVFYTDTERIVNASIVKRIEGENAIPLALQLLNEWADSNGKVEKCFLPTKRGILHKDFMSYRNLYSKLNSDRHVLIALIKK